VIVQLESIIVDINDHVSSYDVDQYELYLYCINATTQATRILKLILIDKEKKKYSLASTGKAEDSLLVAEHPEDTSFTLQIKAVRKKGFFNRLLHKENVVVGAATCTFDKWDNAGAETCAMEMKELGDRGFVKAVGYITMKYECRRMEDSQVFY
jgi:hypothetical protein